MFEFLIFVVTLLLIFAFNFKKYKNRKLPPGPIGVPIFGYLPFLGPTPHKKYTVIGEKYGNIFTLQFGSLPIVVLNNVELIRKAFKSDDFAGRPKSVLAMEVVSNGLTYNEGPAWAEQRKFMLKSLREFGFGKRIMEDAVAEELTKLIDYFKKQTGKPISLKYSLEISVINTLWSIVASEKHSLDDPKVLHMHRVVYEAFIEPEVAGAAFFLPTISKWFPNWTGFSNVLRGVAEMRKIFRDFIDEREQKISYDSCNDYVDQYLKQIKETEDPESSFYQETGRKNLVDVLINLFAAGSDTTSTTLCWSFLYLMKHPDVMQKLRHEIDTAVGRQELPNSEHRLRMPYAEACMHEISRIASIVPGGLLHSTMRDVEFEGYSLPKGTIVMGNLYHVHHDPKYWGDPETFRPERFLNDDGTFLKDEETLTFSVGKRACPAEHLAMTNFFVFLTGLIQTFDFEIDSNNPLPPLDPKPGLVLSTLPYKVILKYRN